jgi:hypothetical protein
MNQRGRHAQQPGVTALQHFVLDGLRFEHQAEFPAKLLRSAKNDGECRDRDRLALKV